MDYKEKYNSALERAKKEWSNNLDGAYKNYRERLEFIFPELKESEDERIRKELIEQVAYITPNNDELDDELNTLPTYQKRIDKYRAWLEKQKDTSSIERVFRPVAGCSITYAATQAIEQQQLGYNIVLAFNGAYIPVEEKTADDIVNEYYSWIKKQGEYLENYDEEEKEKADFVGDGFVECHADFLDFKEGNTYWLEYIGDDKYNVRSDNLLGKTYHITPCQLYTVFKKLTWLEKQSEVTKTSDQELEPKFHPGDWITDGHLTCKVLSAAGKSYELHLYNDDYCHFETDVQSVDKHYHLWSINDAKDGDVLVHNNCTFIFMGIKNGIVNALEENLLCDTNPVCFGEPDKDNDYHPATKEQRDFLFQKIEEAGYEWDSEKKELNKIEQKSVDETEPKFHEGDWITDGYIHYKITEILDDRYIIESIYTKKSAILFEYENRYHLWSIDDAKRGDVLIDAYGNIGMFDKCYDFDWMSFCSLGNNGGFQYFTVEHENEKTHPATKEQRELLFQKMEEAR